MSTRSDRLVPATQVAIGGPTVLATVPAGQTWLVKSVRVCKAAADVPTLTLWLGTVDADGLLLGPLEMPAGKVGLHDAGWHVAEAGDVLAIELVDAPVTVRVSGTRLPAGP